VVYRRKTFSRFSAALLSPIFFHQESSAEIETNGSQTVQGLYGGCIKTFQPNSLNFWHVIKVVCGLALS